MLPYSGNAFFNIRYPANANGFPTQGSIIFLLRAIFLLLEIISVIKSQRQFLLSTGNVYFNETHHSGQWKQIFWLVKTDLFIVQTFFLQAETVIGTSGSQL